MAVTGASVATRNFQVKSLYPRPEVRWTRRSPTRSGRERSSRNESDAGRRASTSPTRSGRERRGWRPSRPSAVTNPRRVAWLSPSFPRNSPNPGPPAGAACYSPSMADTPAPTQPYRVLARKYRPTDFTGLIGQEALVRTLSNAFATRRIAHAFMLTGMRGVGKTTNARIIARALNCIRPDGSRKTPTIHPCGVCDPCVAIAESRHLDVQEMDGASNNGVEEVRQIIDSVRYAPASA